MNLITDLHPCCKCHTWHDVDTMHIYTKSKGEFVTQTGMICPTCRQALYQQTKQFSAHGLHWCLHEVAPHSQFTVQNSQL